MRVREPYGCNPISCNGLQIVILLGLPFAFSRFNAAFSPNFLEWDVVMDALTRIATALRLRCPRCHDGKLFVGLLKMSDHCPACGLKLEPEPGFYLGSIYANYALTVLITTVSFVLLVFGAGFSKDQVIWGCLAFSLLFPLWFFRYARSLWLSLMYQVNSSDFTTPGRPETAGPTGASNKSRITTEQSIAPHLTSAQPETVARV